MFVLFRATGELEKVHVAEAQSEDVHRSQGGAHVRTQAVRQARPGDCFSRMKISLALMRVCTGITFEQQCDVAPTPPVMVVPALTLSFFGQLLLSGGVTLPQASFFCFLISLGSSIYSVEVWWYIYIYRLATSKQVRCD